MRGLMNSRAPISRFERPSRASSRDLSLLDSELAAVLDGAFAGRLAGGQQFAPGALGEPLGTHRREHLVGDAQLPAGIGAALLAAQPLPVKQVSAGQRHADAGAAQPVDRLAVQALGAVLSAE